MPRMSEEEKYELLLKIKEERDKGASWREIGPKLGQAESWASVFWQRNEDLLKKPSVKPQPKMSTIPSERVDILDSIPVSQPRPRPKVTPKALTAEDLRVALMVYLHEHPEDPDVEHVKPKVSKSWGGTSEGGSGWSGAIMKTLEIVAKIGVVKK